MDPLLLTYGVRLSIAAPRPAGAVTRRRDAVAMHPVNPYTLARLMTGKVVASRDELVAAFGMPLEKILAGGGPLYNPDLAAIAARRQPPVDNAQRQKSTKASGAVDDAKPVTTVKPKSAGIKISKPSTFEQKASAPIDVTMQSLAAGGVTCAAWTRMSDVARLNTLMNFGLATSMDANTIAAQVTAACSATPLTTPTTLAVRPGEATKIRDWTTQVQDPSGPAHYTESESDADLRRAMTALERAGITCAAWNAMTLSARENAADAIVRGTVPTQADTTIHLAREIGPAAAQLAERITRRCSSAGSSASGIRDANTLLRMMSMNANGWLGLTCRQQFMLLGHINSALVPPAVTIEEMKRELWEQWFVLYNAILLNTGGWFQWVRIGAYLSRPPLVTDPRQGLVGNCFFIASLAGTAWVRPDVIVAHSWRGGAPAAEPPSTTPTITFADPRSGRLTDTRIGVGGALPISVRYVDLCDSLRPFCHTGNSDQTWPDVYEKAMRVWVSRNDPPRMTVAPTSDIDANAPLYFLDENSHPANVIAGGDGQTWIAWLGGRADQWSTLGAVLARFFGTDDEVFGERVTIGDLWTYLDEHCDAQGKVRSVIYACSIPLEWSPPRGIVPEHAYTLLGIDRVRRLVYLRNPWGSLSPGDPAAQTGEWMGLRLGMDDGVGAVTLQSFFDCFWMLSGNWYAPQRRHDYGINHRWGYYSGASLPPV